jgi:hypothetical protein
MRAANLMLAALLVLVISSCKQSFDPEKEKAAIIKVINEETQAYLDRDFEAMYATHVHDSLNMRLTAGSDSYVFLQGWEDVSKHMAGDQTEDDLGANLHIKVEKSNYRMRVHPKSAFVVCDQKWISAYEDDTTVINSIQVRYLEKVKGEWKIAFVSFIGTDGYGDIEETEELD